MPIVDVNQAIQAIKTAGPKGVRAIPMADQNAISGDYGIQVLREGEWENVLVGVTKKTADDIVAQALNRVICG